MNGRRLPLLLLTTLLALAAAAPAGAGERGPVRGAAAATPSKPKAAERGAQARAAKARAAKRTAAARARAARAKRARGVRVRAAGTQLVANGSFETSLGGWQGWQASLSRVSNGVVGRYSARVTARKSAPDFALAPDGKQVSSTLGGAVYTAQAAVRTDKPGRRICLRIREWNGSALVGDAVRCVVGSTSWQWIPPVSHTTGTAGRALDAYVYVSSAVTNDRFDVDGVSLSVDAPPPPVAPPSGLAALSATTTSVSLGWSASPDLRTTGYRVLQDGVEIARTATTSHTAGALACGRSYSFAVHALDSTGAESAAARATASTAPCPPPPLAPPTSLRAASATGDAVTLEWTGAADERVVAYRVSWSGGSADTAGTRHTVSGLACGTAHAFTVRSVDAAGGVSGGTSATVSTAACAPTPPPPPPPTPSAATCTLWASPSGSDTNAGTDAAPFRSVAKLLGALAAGQTGCLRAGTYAGNLDVRRGGSPGSPITLRSGPNERATIVGRIVVFDSANDLVFRDLDLNGRNASAGSSPVVNGDRIAFIGNDVTNEHTAICFTLGSDSGYGTAHDVVIERNRIHNCGRLPATNHDHGIYVEKSRNARIVDNVIYDNADRGIQLYPDAQGSYIANNVLDGNGQGVIFSGDMGFASSDNVVVDNVISNSKLRYNLESWWPSGNPVGTGNVAGGNCLWNGARGNVGDQTGFTVTGSVIADPLFVDHAAKDFRLRSGSPCAGKGPRL